MNTLKTKTQLHIKCVLSVGFVNYIKYDPYIFFSFLSLFECAHVCVTGGFVLELWWRCLRVCHGGKGEVLEVDRWKMGGF